VGVGKNIFFVIFWAAHRSAALHADHIFSIIIGLQDSQHFPSPGTSGSALSALCSCRHYDPCSIAKRVFRVRAARRMGKAKAL
jgi:hypothetical protein